MGRRNHLQPKNPMNPLELRKHKILIQLDDDTHRWLKGQRNLDPIFNFSLWIRNHIFSNIPPSERPKDQTLVFIKMKQHHDLEYYQKVLEELHERLLRRAK